MKLSDFGWSVNRGAELRTTFCGTPIYLCPEILVGDEYDESVDIWTLGVILYEMLFRSNPFRITCQEELANILNSPIAFDDSSVSDSAKEVIMACLSKKAADRPNIRELMLFEFVLRGHAAD